MIRPASEIEFPPSEALCTKARMIVRMESLGESSDGITSILAKRIPEAELQFHAEIEAMAKEQKRLIENMKRLIGK